jgi:light-regulated signal transduction histidine kinase (bacteriophytochrome)
MKSNLQQAKQRTDADGRGGAGEGEPEMVLLRRSRQLEGLYSVARAVNASLDLGDVLQQALEQVLKALEFPSGVIRLLDAPTGELSVAARHGLAPELETDLSRTVRFTQLFQNLIANAIKFHGEAPPRIHVGAERKAGDWHFTVHDDGIGIEPEYAERVFLIFQRLHSRAEYPGAGSTFHFTIPERREVGS